MADSEQVFYLRGGLGNQLFILAKAISRAQEHHKPVELVTSLLKIGSLRTSEVDDYADFLLELGVRISNRDLSKIEKIGLTIYTLLKESRFSRINSLSWIVDRYFPNLNFGYYQTLNDVRDVSLEMLTFLRFVESKHNYHREGEYIGLHIRRGDYLSKQHWKHGVLSDAYFIKILNENFAKEKRATQSLKLFSDSNLSLDQINLFSSLGFSSVNIDSSNSAWEVLFSLKNSRAIIMSNSSLSWWASWFAACDGKITVFAPFPWSLGFATQMNIYQSGWQLIASEWAR